LAARSAYQKRKATETASQSARKRLAARENYQKRKALRTPSQIERQKAIAHEAYLKRKATETPSQAERRKAKVRENYQKRKENTDEPRLVQRRANNTEIQRHRRENESEDVANERRAADRESHRRNRANLTSDQVSQRRQDDRIRYNVRNHNITKFQLHQQYLQRIFTYPDTPCMICHKLLYPKQVHKVTAGSISQHAVSYLPDELKEVDPLLVSSRHKTHLTNSRRDKMPGNAYWNNLDAGEIPEELANLSVYERRLLSRIFLYQNIINLRPSHRARYWNQPTVEGFHTKGWTKIFLVIFRNFLVKIVF
jgi:hypothetical protein